MLLIEENGGISFFSPLAFARDDLSIIVLHRVQKSSLLALFLHLTFSSFEIPVSRKKEKRVAG